MKTFYLLIASTTLSVALLGCQTPGPTSPGGTQTVEVQKVVAQVKAALSDVQTTLANNKLPPLKQVKVSLQAVTSGKGGVGFDLWVISIGGTYEKDRSQQLDIVLVPPCPGNPKAIATESLTQVLEDMIVSAAQGVKDAGTGPTPLNLSSVDIQIGFTVKEDANASVKIPILTPITPDFSGDLAKTAVHNLTVSFAVPATQMKCN